MKKIFIFIFIATTWLNAQKVLIDSLETSLGQADSTASISILNSLAEAYRPINTEKSLQYASKAIALSESIDDLQGRLLGLLQLGRTQRRLTLFMEALKTYSTAKALCNQIDDWDYYARLLNSIGFVYRDIEDYERSFSHHFEALRILEIHKNQNIAFVYNHIGNIYRVIENYDQALYYSYKALDLHRQYDNTNGIGYAMHRLGIVYNEMQIPDSALAWFNRGLEVRESINRTNLVGHSLLRIGRIYQSQGESRKALNIYKKALDKFKEMGNIRGAAFGKMDIARLHKDLGQLKAATVIFQNALSTQQQLHDQAEMSVIYYEISEIAQMENRGKAAFSHMKESIRLADASGNHNQLKQSLLKLSELYFHSGNYPQAYTYYKKYNEIDEQINNQLMLSKITNMQINFELGKKENEFEKDAVLQNLKLEKQKRIRNNLLMGTGLLLMLVLTLLRLNKIKSKANKELVKAHDKIHRQNFKLEKLLKELRETNATKDTFFSIIAHDLKSSLQIQFSGSRLLSDRIEGLKKDKIIKIANGLKANIQQLFKLLENLIQWSRSQMGRLKQMPQSLNLKALSLERMEILTAIATQKNIILKIEIHDEINIYADRNMILSVLENLILNSIKYSHEGGKITLSASSNNKEVKVIVSDEGIGICLKNLKKLFRIDQHFSTCGTADEKGTGLGLILCKNFIELNGGKIEVESEESKGTKVTFTVPTYNPSS